MTEGYVYAIESGDAVKIGYAADPVRRLAALKTGSHSSLQLIGFARGTRHHEKQIHILAAKERIRGEWFTKGPVISAFIESLPKYEQKRKKSKSIPSYAATVEPTVSDFERRFISVIDAYIAFLGLSDATASTRILNDGKRLTLIRNGAQITVRRANKALAWLSENWPDGAVWPENVNRPSSIPGVAA